MSMFIVLVLFKVLWITMALLWAKHHFVPVLFPLGEDGHAIVTCTTLSLRFQFRDVTISVEEVFGDQTGLVLHAVRQT